MKRILPVALAFAVGVAVGWLAKGSPYSAAVEKEDQFTAFRSRPVHVDEVILSTDKDGDLTNTGRLLVLSESELVSAGFAHDTTPPPPSRKGTRYIVSLPSKNGVMQLIYDKP